MPPYRRDLPACSAAYRKLVHFSVIGLAGTPGWVAMRGCLHAGASGEHLLVVLQGLGALIRGAGPPQLTIEVDQHDPGGIGVEQLLGRLDSLLQGFGQVQFGVEVGEGADALGQHGGVDRHARALVPVAELANPVNRPGTMVALGADQAQQPHEIVWALLRPSRTAGSASSPYAPPAQTDSQSADDVVSRRLAVRSPG
jgi:hypothetical protein